MQALNRILFSVTIMAVSLISCSKKEVKPDCLLEGYVIGFDQCNKKTGRVIAFTNSPDTVITYNFPDTLYDFPPQLFQNYRLSFLFPSAEQKNYKIRLNYRYANQQEKVYVACAGDILDVGFSHYVRDRQIIIECARKADN